MAGNNAVDMSSATLNAEDCKAKRIKVSDEQHIIPDVESINDKLTSFKDFNLTKVLSEDTASKTIFVEGTFTSVDGTAVLVLEKLPFGKEEVVKVLTEETHLVSKFKNNVYGSYNGFPEANVNGIKATVIHPATKKHIEKYQFHPFFVVKETPELYHEIVLPHLKTQQFSMQWVYNILEHKSEVERIIFEDAEPDLGFILLPDLKWNESNISDLYCIAICHRRGLKSLRDLNAEHIPLLENILDKGADALSTKYSIPRCKLRCYMHYQPSYYHMHVHFTNVEYAAPGMQPERAHLVNTVIQNLKMVPDYYQKATLLYTVKENDLLYEKLEAKGAFAK